MFAPSFWCLLLFFLICPQVSAQVVFSEIMYDVSGSDTGREWIEIQNLGVTTVSIATTTWKLVEADTKHSLRLERGSLTIPTNGFFLIVDNIDKFLNDWPNYYGTIFSSSFSLSNAGEKLTLIGDNGLVQDTVIYNIGNNHKDNWSLQKFGGDWRVSFPTPGSVNFSRALIDPLISDKDFSKPKVVPVEKVFIQKTEDAKSVSDLNSENEEIDFNDDLLLDNQSSVMETGDLDQSDLTVWLYRLGGIITLGLCAVFTFKPNFIMVDKKEDEFEIIEE